MVSLPNRIIANGTVLLELLALIVNSESEVGQGTTLTWQLVKKNSRFSKMTEGEIKAELDGQLVSGPVNSAFTLMVDMGLATTEDDSNRKITLTNAAYDWYAHWQASPEAGANFLANGYIQRLNFAKAPTHSLEAFSDYVKEQDSTAKAGEIQAAFNILTDFFSVVDHATPNNTFVSDLFDDPPSQTQLSPAWNEQPSSDLFDDPPSQTQLSPAWNEQPSSDLFDDPPSQTQLSPAWNEQPSSDSFDDTTPTVDQSTTVNDTRSSADPEPEPSPNLETTHSTRVNADNDFGLTTHRNTPEKTIEHHDPTIANIESDFGGKRRPIVTGGAHGLLRNAPIQDATAPLETQDTPDTNTPFQRQRNQQPSTTATPEASKPHRPTNSVAHSSAPHHPVGYEPPQRPSAGSRMDEARRQQAELAQNQQSTAKPSSPLGDQRPTVTGDARRPIQSNPNLLRRVSQDPAPGAKPSEPVRGGIDNRRYGERAKAPNAPQPPPNNPQLTDNPVLLTVHLPNGKSLDITEALVKQWVSENGGTTADAIQALSLWFLNNLDSGA